MQTERSNMGEADNRKAINKREGFCWQSEGNRASQAVQNSKIQQVRAREGAEQPDQASQGESGRPEQADRASQGAQKRPGQPDQASYGESGRPRQPDRAIQGAQ